MAKQLGIIPLKGTIGNITFYKTKAGHLAREKGGIDASRIANDPALSGPVKTDPNLAGPAKRVKSCGPHFVPCF